MPDIIDRDVIYLWAERKVGEEFAEWLFSLEPCYFPGPLYYVYGDRPDEMWPIWDRATMVAWLARAKHIYTTIGPIPAAVCRALVPLFYGIDVYVCSEEISSNSTNIAGGVKYANE